MANHQEKMVAGNKENQSELNSTFFLSFVGQKIIITTNLMHTLTHQSAENQILETTPIFYEGILLDYDLEYLYLGNTPNEIHQAVNRSSIIHVMVSNDATIYDEILDSMPDPEGDTEVN